MDKCPICLGDANLVSPKTGEDVYEASCDRCGQYQISRSAAHTDIGEYVKPYELSGAIRNLYEHGEEVYLTTANIQTLLDGISIPTDPLDRIDLLLEHIFQKSGKPSVLVRLDQNIDYPLIYGEDAADFVYYLSKAEELGYVERGGNRNRECRLSLYGLQRITELRKTKRKANQAFVAMWFDSALDDAWENGFKPALKQTGYDPIRIDLAEHNEKICDRIIAEIRKSGLIVADFTGQRGGVYFEVGFAMGLGIPVVWTCRDTDVENLHFDTRQYNHIVWSDPEELRKKLINRIEATVPERLQR